MPAQVRTTQHETDTDVRHGPPAPEESAPGPAAAGVADPGVERPVTLEVSESEPSPVHQTLEDAAASPSRFFEAGELNGSSLVPGLLMAGGAIIVLFILMRRLRRGHRASAPSEETPRERIEAIRARAGDRARIDAFKVDAEEFTRQMAAILDTKAERLERLIEDADDRLGRLERAQRGAPAGGRLSPGAIDAARTPPHRAPIGEADADPLHERIYRLADDGLDAVQIAQQTGRPTGQIELILALRS